jgi:hypothetical protein
VISQVIEKDWEINEGYVRWQDCGPSIGVRLSLLLCRALVYCPSSLCLMAYRPPLPTRLPSKSRTAEVRQQLHHVEPCVYRERPQTPVKLVHIEYAGPWSD